MTAIVWIGVAVLGSLGSVLRFGLDGLVQRRAGRDFPFGTLAVNLLGSLALGILAGADVGDHAILLGGTATLGAFTTFSTWMYETDRLAEDGESRLAIANILVPLGAGLVAALAGWAAGGAL